MNNDFNPPALTAITSFDDYGIALYGNDRPSSSGVQAMPGGGMPTVSCLYDDTIAVGSDKDATE